MFDSTKLKVGDAFYSVKGRNTAINYAAALTSAVADVKVLRKKMMDARAKKDA